MNQISSLGELYPLNSPAKIQVTKDLWGGFLAEWPETSASGWGATEDLAIVALQDDARDLWLYLHEHRANLTDPTHLAWLSVFDNLVEKEDVNT